MDLVLSAGGEDLFTKIEFSRRVSKGTGLVEPVSAEVVRSYKMAPLVVSHYDAFSAVLQKIQALAQRAVLQARDVFDLFQFVRTRLSKIIAFSSFSKEDFQKVYGILLKAKIRNTPYIKNVQQLLLDTKNKGGLLDQNKDGTFKISVGGYRELSNPKPSK